MTTTDAAADGTPILTRATTYVMAAAAGIAVASIYYNQPMLGIIEAELPDPISGLIPTATQLGYAAGLFMLVPLGDLVERRRLIVVQFVMLAAAMAAAAMAPSAAWVVVASLFVGIASTVAQQIVPFAAHLSAPARRGATIGTVMAGLLTGILFSRTLAGFVASHAGWRDMFWLGVPLALAAAAAMAARLPRSEPERGPGYGGLLWSIVALWRSFPELRLAAFTQALIFAAFTAFWTVLAFRLQQTFGLGAEIAGLFGVVGAIGVFAAPVAGHVADRHGPHRVVAAGALLTLVSWLVFGVWTSLIGITAGVVLLDFAVQIALVSNQHIIYALKPEARARLNTAFMGTMFLGGAAGSALATFAWQKQGWTAVVVLAVVIAALASILQIAALIRGGRDVTAGGHGR